MVKSYLSLDKARQIVQAHEQFLQKNMDTTTGLLKTNSSLFNYTSLAAALKVIESTESDSVA